MRKIILGAVLVAGTGALQFAGAADAGQSGTVTTPIDATVANVCIFGDGTNRDIAGLDYRYGFTAHLGTYRATAASSVTGASSVDCTKNTKVTIDVPATLKLLNTAKGSTDYLDTNVTASPYIVASTGQYSPEKHFVNTTVTAPKGQFGASAGTYTGDLVVKFTYF